MELCALILYWSHLLRARYSLKLWHSMKVILFYNVTQHNVLTYFILLLISVAT